MSKEGGTVPCVMYSLVIRVPHPNSVVLRFLLAFASASVLFCPVGPDHPRPFPLLLPRAGDRYGLIGQNGCGKSTFLRCLAAREVPIPEHMDIYLLAEEAPPTELSALNVSGERNGRAENFPGTFRLGVEEQEGG